MFGLFKTPTFVDERLGELRRSRGAWRGTLGLGGAAPVSLVVSGPAGAPDPEAMRLARSIARDFPGWRPAIAQALFEHYEPYAEAVAAGEEEAPADALPPIREASDVWAHTTIEFVQVSPLDGHLTVEIGCRVTWDDEHTLGARLRDGELIGLNGSVLAP
jgi:hypothetical protein